MYLSKKSYLDTLTALRSLAENFEKAMEEVDWYEKEMSYLKIANNDLEKEIAALKEEKENV